jgi:hypothetical protein
MSGQHTLARQKNIPNKKPLHYLIFQNMVNPSHKIPLEFRVGSLLVPRIEVEGALPLSRLLFFLHYLLALFPHPVPPLHFLHPVIEGSAVQRD